MRTFLSWKYHCFFLLTVFALLFFKYLLFAFLVVVFYLLLMYLFREVKDLYLIKGKQVDNHFSSPIEGIISNIKENVRLDNFQDEFSEIKMVTNRWGPFGIYMPKTAEVIELLRDGREISATFINDDDQFVMKVKAHLQDPRVWIKSGDIGHQYALVGNFFGRGEVLLYCGKDHSVIVKENEKAYVGKNITNYSRTE